MLKKERQAFILRQVNLHHRVLSANLKDMIAVSEDTIRRDLQEMDSVGLLTKVHGGALSTTFISDYKAPKEVYAQDKKRIIAKKAASLIHDGMVVLTSGGTTLQGLAKELPQSLKATFVSGSIPVLLEYIQHPSIDVIAVGDKISKNSKITVGQEAIARIRSMRVDLCLLGVNALDLENGITDNDWDVVQLKKAMVESAQQVICLTLAEKLDSFQPIQVCPARRIHTLITDLEPSNERLRPYAEAGIRLI